MPNQPSPTKSFKENLLDYRFGDIRYGLGCAWLGRTYEDRHQVEKDLRTLETAYTLGFRYFDTAAAYGMSEKVVGEFIATIPRNTIFLATKSNLPESVSPKAACDHLLRSLEESLRRLKTDTLDLYQIHDIETLSNVLVPDGVLDVLLKLKQQGVIRYCGVATRQHHLLEQAVENGAFDTILTYRDFNLVNRSAAALIQKASDYNVGIINASPLAAVQTKGLDLQDKLVLAAALQFPLTNPKIDLTLTGPASVAEVTTSVEAFSRKVDWTNWEG